MRAATLCHTRVFGDLTTLWVAVYSTMEQMFGRSLDETSWVEVMNELVPNIKGWRSYTHGLRGLA
jgi:hypothetical protein